MIGEEVKDIRTLAKVKNVEEMLPKVAETNQIYKNAPKIGEEQYKIIEDCLQLDATVEEACMAAGISVPSYYKHREKNPDFARRMDLARQFPKMIARAAVQRRIRQGDARTALEYLKLRDRQYKPDAMEETENKGREVKFTFVAANEGLKEADSQMSTEQRYAYDGYATSGEEEKLTPWENEDQALKNIAG